MDTGPERDLVGYGANRPAPGWPGDARLALNLVLNYEEGAEYCVLNGDDHAESILSELGVSAPVRGARNLNIESSYEYGARVGVWRILRVLGERQVPFTVYGVGLALERNPAVAEAVARLGCDVVAHGWRWIDYRDVSEDIEREHIARCRDTIEHLTGTRPIGWFTGRPSINTRRLVVEEGGFLYDCEAINDDLPYWVRVAGRNHLVISHTFDTNDGRFARGQGFETAESWFVYMRDAFDWLYQEGEHTPGMLTVAMHCRLMGRPARMSALTRFLDHVARHPQVWLCRREEIARHWYAEHPA